jgi:DNA topoisomerase-2
MLKEKGFCTIDNKNDDNDDNSDNAQVSGDFKYLTRMPMDSVTEENVNKLNKEHESKQSELLSVKNTTIHKMWLNELELLKEQYLEYKENRERLMSGLDGPGQAGSSKSKKKVVSKGPLKSKNTLLVVE